MTAQFRTKDPPNGHPGTHSVRCPLSLVEKHQYSNKGVCQRHRYASAPQQRSASYAKLVSFCLGII